MGIFRSSLLTVVAISLALFYFGFAAPTRSYAEPEGRPAASAHTTASLTSLQPEGDNVEPPSQIVLTFDRAIAPLGRMERTAEEIAISIEPRLACQWRWINTSALGCTLNEGDRPKVATKYSIVVPQVFDRTRGEVLEKEVTLSFTTRRPEITESWFKGWNSPGLPVIGISLNQRVSLETLRSHLALVDERGTSHEITIGEMPLTPDEIEAQRTGVAGPPRWLITPVKELPPSTALSLKVRPGIASEEGREPGVENRDVVSFSTFPPFSFLGISCTTTEGKAVEILASGGAPLLKPERCDPLNGVMLLFSAPVLKGEVARALKAEPDLRGGRADFDPWDDVYSQSQLLYPYRKGQRYFVSLPYGLRANKTYTLAAEGGSIHDEFGRALEMSLYTTFSTSHRRPRYHLENPVSVLEKGTDSKLPLIVNNLSEVTLNYQVVTSSENKRGNKRVLKPYDAQDIAYPFPIDVREMLNGRSGIVQGRLSTSPKTEEGSQWFFSQVTPYEVHAKLGHFSSLVWVTSFATGAPIADAKVSLIADTMSDLSATPQSLASSTTDARGLAALPGTRTFDPGLGRMFQWEANSSRIFVKVEKDGEVAYLPASWDFQAYAGEVYPSSRKEYGHVHAWGTTAQGVYKVGDSIQFAVWARDQNDTTFVTAPRSGYTLQVIDPTGKSVFEVEKITLSEFGGYAAEFSTKRDAAVGWYSFALSAPFLAETLIPMRVLVSDFTPAPFKVTASLNGEVFHPEDSVALTTEARLHAGGPYADAGTHITATISGTSISPLDPRYERFNFGSASDQNEQVFQGDQRVDARGDLLTTFALPNVDIPYGTLTVESAVQDDRGKYVADAATAKFVGRDRFVGIDHEGWLLTAGAEATFQGLVIDEGGRPLPQVPFEMKVEYEDTKAIRVKSAGNVYTTKYENEWREVFACKPTSGSEAVPCTFTPSRPGEYRLSGTVVDTKGRAHRSEITRWAGGKGDVVWNAGENTELQIMPEKRSYKVGEVAKFLIQNPYPGAQALFTTERYGIQRSWTKTVTESAEVVELPITKDHIPGIFFSATIVSPRVGKPIENKVDLAKPSFRMGYTKIAVVDPAKKIQVDVKARQEVYKPRDTVTVDILGRSAGEPQQGMEYAVTVLDAAVFDLIQGKDSYFDPYRGFYNLDSLDVRNFNLIRMLVGRQNFEKKGANAGGDGGITLDMRTIKRYVSYWNPSVTPDALGKATISFEAPDNLTGWKVFVMALTKEDQMGLGLGGFTVNKEIEVRSALPNQVREGDTFTATFTVMNRTDRVRDITVETKIEGAAATGAPQVTTIRAEPFKRYPVHVGATARTIGEARFIVSARDGAIGDSVLGTLSVLPRVAVHTGANFGSSDGTEVKESIEFPSDMNPNTGSLDVIMSSSILGSLEGAFSYMREYPYECWEQRLSRGVAAAHYLALRKYLPANLAWPEAEAVVKQTLSDLSQFQTRSGGMGFYTAREDTASPYLSAYTALALGWLRELGHAVPEKEEEKLLTYLTETLKADLFPTFFSPGMRSSVRAVALAALSARGRATFDDVSRYKEASRTMNLFGKAMYLAAASRVPKAEGIARDVERQIRSAAQRSAGTIRFTEPVEAVSMRILDSNMRTHCAILETFMRASASGPRDVRERLEPLVQPLVRSITLDRKRKDRWENTQENAFCMQALAIYAARYERAQGSLDLGIHLDGEELGKVTLRPASNEPVEVSRALKETDPGRKDSLTITPSGNGRFYYTARLSYSPKLLKSTPTNAGMEVVREYSVKRNGVWTLIKDPLALKQGELVRVDLFLSLSSPRSFVVVSDPIPGGLEPMNRDLATSSTLTNGGVTVEGPPESIWFDGREWIDFGVTTWGFYHKELRHASARFYSEFLPPGHYHLSYVSQAIASGEFVVLPTHAEEMYDPDVFGDSSLATLRVSPAEGP